MNTDEITLFDVFENAELHPLKSGYRLLYIRTSLQVSPTLTGDLHRNYRADRSTHLFIAGTSSLKGGGFIVSPALSGAA